jgi:hypothetical protein
MTYLIEYLGEFEFIFETILAYGSGDQMGSPDAKNRHRKSHAWAPLSSWGIHRHERTGWLELPLALYLFPSKSLKQFIKGEREVWNNLKNGHLGR